MTGQLKRHVFWLAAVFNIFLPSLAIAQDAALFKKDFLHNYRRLIDGKTVICREIDITAGGSTDELIKEKQFKKLTDLSQLQACIDYFWKERDPNPSTEANEFKDSYDKKIADIENEVFLTDSDLRQFRFGSNGGLNGDVAWVYLLKGQPTSKADLLDNNYTSDLMVWVYVYSSGSYQAFLFYRPMSIGQFRLFTQYYGRLEDRLAVIGKFRTNFQDVSSLESIYQEIQQSIYGHMFLTALYQFSSSGEYPEQVLRSPKPAAAIAKDSGIKILGLPKISAEETYIFGKRFNSLTPVSVFRLGTDKDTGQTTAYLLMKLSDVDWRLVRSSEPDKEDRVEAVYKLRIIFVRKKDRKVYIYENHIRLNTMAGKAESDGFFAIHVSQLGLATDLGFKSQIRSLAELPPGDYRVDVFFLNVVSQKSNSWVQDYQRP